MPQHVSYVLVAEFDIDKGAVIAQQYPYSTGTDEQILAELMLPEGVHTLMEDWTVFFLNQSHANAIVPLNGEDDSSKPQRPNDAKPKELMYVLSLVRTKHDKSVRRGAVVKALAICTHLHYFQIFKPVLLIALDEYYKNPTESCVKEIFDTLNSLDLTMVPQLTRHEKLIMRLSDRTDLFAEKFARRSSREVPVELISLGSGMGDSVANSLKRNGSYELLGQPLARSRSAASLQHHSRTGSGASAGAPSDTSHNSIGITPNGDDNAAQDSVADQSNTLNNTSESLKSRDDFVPTSSSDSSHLAVRRPPNRDTHFYETSVKYANIPLPIKVPVSIFPEEAGDFSLIKLINTFSSSTNIIGPLHPHLHTNGAQTHPIILIFNAIVTQKRVIFAGHGRPTSEVINCVLAACALVSGGGCYLRGFTERAFPYINLSTMNILEPFATTGYVAGVTNPIFETLPNMWDVFCNIVTNTITIHKDIPTPAPAPSLFPVPPTLYSVTTKTGGIVRAESSVDDEFGRSGGISSAGPGAAGPGGPKPDFIARQDSYDVHFIEDILALIANHVGEMSIRARFAEYVYRYLQLAARYEEDTQHSTEVGYPSMPYAVDSRTGKGTLGSGIRFSDEVNGLRELNTNAARIEGWRKGASYEYWVHDFQNEVENNPIRGFDLEHQILRLRNGKGVPEGEVALIIKTICENVKTYDQVVELLAHCPPQHGGLQPLAMCLFHQQEYIRDMTVGLLNVIRDYTVGFQSLQHLNQFFRYSYIRQVHDRQSPWREGFTSDQNASVISASGSQKAPSNHSQVSLGAA